MPSAILTPDHRSGGEASHRFGPPAVRFLGCLVLLGGFAGAPTFSAADPPAPSTPVETAALLKWCWENRDITRYSELFTADFHFAFAPDDTAGAPFPDHEWGRDDEIASATHLFGGGSATQPSVTGVTLTFTGTPTAGTYFIPGLTYPWHQQMSVPWALEVTRADETTLHAAGQAVLFVVRGDSASLPQELIDRGFTPDPGRWYIERWEDRPRDDLTLDRPPVVAAPAVVNGKAGTPITIHVTVQDPDGDPILSLGTEGMLGATFVTAPDNQAGTLAWTPPLERVGSHRVTFTASNALSGSASTLINVRLPNVAPVAALVVSPASGTEPLTVTADAAGSSDTDGRIGSYRFDFGDGSAVIQTTSVVTHTYRAGSWTLMLTVTDDDGASHSTTATVTVAPGAPPPPQPNLVRNPSFEIDTHGWGAYAGSILERVAGGFDGGHGLQMTGPAVNAGSFGINDSPDWIRPTSAAGMRYRFSAWVRSADSHGKARLRVREYSMATKARLGLVTSVGVTLSPEWQRVQVDYTTMAAGSTLDFQVCDFPVTAGEVFVTDDVSIRDITGVAGIVPAEGEAEVPGEDVAALEPALYPSPVRSAAVLSFATSRAGALRVEILDLAGRRVRRLAQEPEAAPGMHVLSIDRTGDDGRPMGPGVYFYRIEASEGTRTGRFVMLR